MVIIGLRLRFLLVVLGGWELGARRSGSTRSSIRSLR
jgi:hypothetical protein